MEIKIVLTFCIAVLIRLISFLISNKNERNLKLFGAVEYGKSHSIILMFSHTIFYFSAFVEGLIRKTSFDTITQLGIIVYIISTLFLCIVIYQLGNFWTFKLIIAKDHCLNKGFIFKYFRHPNYFLNVIPELIAIILICEAWITLTILFPIHLIFLIRRIIQEERIMRHKFAGY
ncbi:MAG: hypothetical protein A2104_08700 [Candidatus Melainabacteria bacterium GWF2_32_7]|nr:MAG: hypothetical protein A2104_08700 [Candidatus Melainabacteria bacterium GWF2_32_7]OGI22696.1 MAG: hypothetical protein A2255_06985 [Candidatus Melainabacteria bacterium RIFOXYA2_FULL_32_9]